MNFLMSWLATSILILGTMASVDAQIIRNPKRLDTTAEKFLEANRKHWHDWNVPYEDGRVLYNLIIKNNYKSALEIGTSTGHSGVWIAWALSKTGGKLITVEIDEDRYKTALKNFKEAGVEAFIDARLGDARQIVKQ